MICVSSRLNAPDQPFLVLSFACSINSIRETVFVFIDRVKAFSHSSAESSFLK